MKLNAHEKGIFLEFTPESMLTLGPKGMEIVTSAATYTVLEPGETPDSPPTRTKNELWRMSGSRLRIPKGVLPKLPDDWEINIKPGEEGERVKFSLRPISRFPVKLEPAQMDILEAIRNAESGGHIEAAMGAGKSWILLAIVLGHPLLRPAAISGKGEKDTRQLLEKLRKLGEEHPEFAEPIMLSGLGRSLSKKDSKTLEAGEGIVVCTHAGIQNLPPNTKLLVLDEGHAAATTKRVTAVMRLRNLKKIYSLTGTSGLRGDGGDELLWGVVGPNLATKSHEEFEKTGRVAPALIKGYHFTGRGIYAENPYMPDQTPQDGYSFHATWVENHRGRHQFVADLVASLPYEETKLIFVPHVLHAVRIGKAIEKKIHELYGDLSPEQRELLSPVIFHAKADKKDKFYVPKEEAERRIKLLVEGKIKVAIATDFLSTGFDTNMIDHVIDASGQKAIITNIQRSGRGSRPRTNSDGTQKITQIHTVMDKTHPVLHQLAEKRFAALCAYYGHQEGVTNPEREGGCFRFKEPPWVPQNERKEKLRPTFREDAFKSSEPATFDPASFKKKS